MLAQLHEGVAREANLLAIGLKVTIHQVRREDIMPSRNRRVSRKDGSLTNQLDGVFMRMSGLDEFSQKFQREKGGMSFIGMPHHRGKPEST